MPAGAVHPGGGVGAVQPGPGNFRPPSRGRQGSRHRARYRRAGDPRLLPGVETADERGPVTRSQSAPASTFDPSRYSYHVDERFYAALLDELGRWDREWDPVDRDTLAECEAVLFREARLLDGARFEDWTELFTSDCLYRL